jgi:hypothetical protein
MVNKQMKYVILVLRSIKLYGPWPNLAVNILLAIAPVPRPGNICHDDNRSQMHATKNRQK